jgi:hypothetical protein
MIGLRAQISQFWPGHPVTVVNRAKTVVSNVVQRRG